jgi:hypothetical protein
MAQKPSANEEEYARRQEQELLAKRRREAEARRATDEAAQLQALHFMRCPKCGQPLREERYHGIQVDRCAACGGIWFDSGEAESLLDREPSAAQAFFGDLFKGLGGATKRP